MPLLIPGLIIVGILGAAGFTLSQLSAAFQNLLPLIVVGGGIFLVVQ